MKPSVELLGDSAVIVAWRFIDDVAAWRTVRNAAEHLDGKRAAGIIAVVPAFNSLTVYYDCARIGWREAEAWIVATLESVPPASDLPRRHLSIPVCYDIEFALDLPTVAAAHGLSTDDVVRLHASAAYVVQMIGFSPGFPYLAGLPSQLHTRRLAQPRLRVSAGSVAIGGRQTGIYSLETPGGWNVIGRTPLRLFDPRRNAPSLLQSGDQIRFVPIDREQFDRLRECL